MVPAAQVSAAHSRSSLPCRQAGPAVRLGQLVPSLLTELERPLPAAAVALARSPFRGVLLRPPVELAQLSLSAVPLALPLLPMALEHFPLLG